MITLEQVSGYLADRGMSQQYSPIDVWLRMDRDYPGDRVVDLKTGSKAGSKSVPKTGTKKRNCGPKSNPCGNACVPIKKKCRKGGLGSAQERLRRLRQSGASSDDVGKAKKHINELTSDNRTSRNENTVDALRQRLKGRVLEAIQSKPSSLAEIDPSSIEVDPKRFQYKIAGELTKSGTVGSLAGVKSYDPNLAGILQVWKDPKDGKTYVVNGHNRLDLAKKLGAEEVAVRYIKAPDAKTARSIGALTNIAEGRGDALDSAKFFRDTGISKEDLVKRGIPMREKIAQDGLALSKLDDTLFRKTIDGDISTARAAIIGGSGLDHAKQRDLSALIDKEGKKRNLTDSAISEMVDIAKSASTYAVQEFSLFGTDNVVKSNMIEKAQLQSAIKKRLSREKKLFGTVAKSSSAADLERGGNTIDREQSGAISDKADRALLTFDKLKGLTGPISSAINSAADRIAKGENAKKVEKELYETILNTDAFGNLKVKPMKTDALDDFYVSAIQSAIQKVLIQNGLAHRYDAYDVYLNMDGFVKKAGIAKGGGKCGRGWVGIRGSCERMKRGGDRKDLQRIAMTKFVNNQRKAKKLPAKGSVTLRRSIAGKTGHPTGSLAYEKEQLREKYGGGAVSRIERLNQTEERRGIVSQGGLKRMKANAAAGVQEFDYVNPPIVKKKSSLSLAPTISATKTPKDTTKSGAGDRVRNIADRLAAESTTQKKAAAKLLTAAAKLSQNHEATVKELAENLEQAPAPRKRSGKTASPQLEPIDTPAQKQITPNRSGLGGKVRDIADKLSRDNNISDIASRRIAKAAQTIAQNQDDVIDEGAKGLNAQLDRQSGKQPKGSLTTESVNPFNAKQGRQFAEQQAAQAKAEGRTADARKWQDEAKVKARSELATMIQGKSANQQNLFGVTEYASDMPLFSQPSQPSQKPKQSTIPGNGTVTAEERARQRAMDNAPVSIANSRKSTEPRRKGRSVD